MQTVDAGSSSADLVSAMQRVLDDAVAAGAVAAASAVEAQPTSPQTLEGGSLVVVDSLASLVRATSVGGTCRWLRQLANGETGKKCHCWTLVV